MPSRTLNIVYNAKTLETFGTLNEWKLNNPDKQVGSEGLSCLMIGDKITGHHAFEKELIDKLGLQKLHNETKENFIKDQKKKRGIAEKEATVILDNMEAALNETLKKYNCSIDHTLEGDTHGVDSYQYITVTVNGFDFEREI